MLKSHPMSLPATISALLGLIALFFSESGCGGGSSPQTSIVPPPSSVASVSVTPSSATIKAGTTKQFSATALDSNGNVVTGVSFVWSSKAPSVASVDGNGLATTSAPGNVSITATTEGVTGAATLTVNPTSASVIPTSFYGFTINQSCSISNTDAQGGSCGNPTTVQFPEPPSGLPFTWARSLGSGRLKWSDLVRCDPTGGACPVPGSGCPKNGASCPSSQLVAGCTPNAAAADDPNNCAYVWTVFNFWTGTYNSHAIDWMYDAYYTPDYLSVRGSRCVSAGHADFGADSTCVGPADACGGDGYGCDPPFDIDSTPGSGKADGTDQNYKNFVTAFMKHLQQNGAHIRYWEIWNEPNICGQWNSNDLAGNNCTTANGAPSTATANQLVRMAQDARSIIPTFDPSVSITSPPMTDISGLNNYLSLVLSLGGATLFDAIDFHGYFNTQTGCPGACPAPEMFLPEWNALQKVMSAGGVASKPAFNTEFSWGANSNTTLPDMRAAFAARSYLLQESAYPALARVQWYGEDFPINLSPNSNNSDLPSGGSGEFWNQDNLSPDDCTTPDSAQGGYDCPAGVAMNQVAKWTVGGTFDGLCTCSASSTGDCTATPPTGIFQCSIQESSGSPGLFVWDSTALSFPCTNAACGSTVFTIPSGYTSDWQDLNGNKNSLGGATTVIIGAKPILLEN